MYYNEKTIINGAVSLTVMTQEIDRKTDDTPDSVWELYGLKTNPFDTCPLLVKGGIIPIESFSGRTELVKRLSNVFQASEGSRCLVVGNPGVGKTSFVNYVRHKFIKKQFFSPFQEIKLVSDWNTNDFILNTLSAIYSTLIQLEKQDTRYKRIINRLKPLVAINQLVDRGGSLSVLGSGAGYHQNTQVNLPPTITTTQLHGILQETASNILKIGYSKIILHYNNLEVFEEDENKLKRIMTNIRDILQMPRVHFVFVGSLNHISLFQTIPRISSIFHEAPIILNPVSENDVWEIIGKRLELLRIQDLKTIEPCTKGALKVLYRLFNGNIRTIFNSLTTAVLHSTTSMPRVLDETSLKASLRNVAETVYARDMKASDRRIISVFLKHEEVTNKIIAKETGMRPQNVSTYLKRLLHRGCITVSRSAGRKKYYQPKEWVKWLKLNPE